MDKKKLINLLCIAVLLVSAMLFVACDGSLLPGGKDGVSLGMYGEIYDYMEDHPEYGGDWNQAAMGYIESKLPAEYELVMRFSDTNYEGATPTVYEDIEHKYVRTAAGLWLEQTDRRLNPPHIDGGFKLKYGTGGGDDILYMYDSGVYALESSEDPDVAEQVEYLKMGLFSIMTWYGQFGAIFDLVEYVSSLLGAFGFDFDDLMAEEGVSFEIDRNATLTVNGTTYTCDKFTMAMDGEDSEYETMVCYVDKASGICLKMNSTTYTEKGGEKVGEYLIETTTFKTSNVTPIVFPE